MTILVGGFDILGHFWDSNSPANAIVSDTSEPTETPQLPTTEATAAPELTVTGGSSVRPTEVGTLQIAEIQSLTSKPNEMPKPPYTTILAINQTQQSDSHESISVEVTTIEMQRNDRMRWNFIFENASNEDSEIAIETRGKETYLSDEFGNRYDVMSDPLGAPDIATTIPLQAGVRAKH